MKKITEANMRINDPGYQSSLRLAYTKVDVKLVYKLAETLCKLWLYRTSWAHLCVEEDG